MRKWYGFMFMFILLNAGCALVVNREQIHATTAVQFPPREELKVGVLPLLAPTPGDTKYAGYWGGKGTSRTLENAGQSVADAITAALVGVKNITLIERSQLEQILREHELTMAGIVDAPDFDVLMEIFPVDALIFGTVSAFQTWNEAGNWGSVVAFNARLVDVRTGKILCTMLGSSNEHNGAPEEMAYRIAAETVKTLIKKSKGR